MISQEIVAEIKSKAVISEVIEVFLKLKKTGADYTALCPFHNEKTPSFSVSKAKGIYKCFGCGRSGDSISFLMEKEGKTYLEALQWLAEKYNVKIEQDQGRREYQKPLPRLEKVSQKAIEFFESRRISNNTLLRFGITEAKEWMPQHKKEVQTICFNYFRNEQLVNIKFRGPEKSFKLEKNAELIFFNLDSLKGEKWAVIVEGEIDCMTCHEEGIFPVVSVPNGASAGSLKLEYLDNCWQDFEDKEKIIIATDDDEPGRRLRDELGRRLGIERCWTVHYPEGCKDLNEVRMKHEPGSVKACIENAVLWPISGIMTMDEIFPVIDQWYEHGYPTGAKTRIPGFDPLLTFAEGQMTTITGIPGHGKDEFTNWIMCSLARYEGWPWAVCGFEESIPETTTKLQEKLTGKAFAHRKDTINRMSRSQYEWAVGMIDQFFHFINPDEIETGIDSILEVASQLVRRHGIRGLYLNPWNWIEHNRPTGMNETEYVSLALTKIIKWARKYKAHVLLLAHTTKMPKGKDGKYEIPTLYNINGSANFFNKTHNGITVYRNYDTNIADVYVQKVKQSWYGQTGFSSYQYDTLTRQYTFLSSSIPESNLPQQPGMWRPIELAYENEDRKD